MIIKLQENKSKRVQIVKVGKFNHADYGKFSFTLSDLQEMKVNFDSNVTKQKIDENPVVPFDYSHNEGAKAAGWITALFIEKDENNINSLFASVSWTPEAAKKIKNNEFKFVSPWIHRRFKDNETGTIYNIVLMGVALTNIPFLRDMEAVHLLSESRKKAFESLKMSDHESDLNLKIGNNMPTTEEMLEGFNEMPSDEQTKFFDALVKKMESDVLTKNSLLSEKLKKSDKSLTDQKNKLKLSETELKTLKVKMSASNEVSDRLKLAEGEAKDLKKEVMSLTKKMAENDKKAEFDIMLSEGKVCEAQREAYLKADMTTFIKNAKVTKLDEAGMNSQEEDDTNDPELKIDKLAQEKMAKTPGLQYGEAITLVFSEKPQLAQQYNNQ